MFKSPTPLSLIGAGLLAGLAAQPSQAAAAPLAITVPSAMPLAAIATTRTACLPGTRTAEPVAMTGLTGQNATVTSAASSKASAILGGRMSALERMRAQQMGAATAQEDNASMAASLPAAGAVLPIAAIGFACPSAQDTGNEGAIAAVSSSVDSANAFLGTARVKIGKTRFDKEWKRVADKSLSQRDLTAALGSVPSERDALLGKVNSWVNEEIAYRSDKGGDKWADARSTLSRRAGDCEDYAILKMQMLAAAGIARDDLMLTLARDTLRRIDHAVLLVRNDSGWVMLDMQSNRVAPATSDYGYKPVMSFAGNDSFLHGKKYTSPSDGGKVRKPRRLALAE